MDELAAQEWLATLGVSRETQARLALLVDLLREEATRQNLLSSATLPNIWVRHIVDSAQLFQLGNPRGNWIDLGSGAGLPGLVLGILGCEITLIEERRLRSEWLRHAAATLALKNVQVLASSVERVPTQVAGVITARAFAPLGRLLTVAHRFSTPSTTWVLPKGRSASAELVSVATTWHGDWTMVPSATDPHSSILVGRDIRPRTSRR